MNSRQHLGIALGLVGVVSAAGLLSLKSRRTYAPSDAETRAVDALRRQAQTHDDARRASAKAAEDERAALLRRPDVSARLDYATGLRGRTQLAVRVTGTWWDVLDVTDPRCGAGFLDTLTHGTVDAELLKRMGFRSIRCGAAFRDTWTLDLAVWPNTRPRPE